MQVGHQGNENWNWKGAHGTLDDTSQKCLIPVPNATGETGYGVSSGGATAVWALKDPKSGNLDRIQIVKGWRNPRSAG